MKQGTLLYLGMVLLLGSGFEVIRRVGNTLTPPPHMAGVWRLSLPTVTAPCPILEFGSSEEQELQVEQSGRYLHLSFPDTHHTRLRAYFTDETLQGSGPSARACATGTTVDLRGHLSENRLNLTLSRSSQLSETPAPTLSLSATRTRDNAASETIPSVQIDHPRKKE